VTDWDTRLAVTVGTQLITPIENWSSSLTTAFRPQHSLEVDNVGFVRQNFSFTFTFNVRALGTAGQSSSVAQLTKLALEGTEFQVSIVRAEGSQGDQWAFQEELFKRCFATSIQPSNLTLQDSPMATVNGICLQYQFTDRAGVVVKNTP
jgi:hypothetical protein